jgi:Ca2+-binding RTX toxin-like protein
MQHRRAITAVAAGLATLSFAGLAGAATIIGTPQGELLRGTDQADRIDARAGDDTVVGFQGDDRLRGGFGADKVFSNEGNDRSRGGPGPDVVGGGLGDDRLWGGFGDDFVRGGIGNDRIFAGPGDDLVASGEGDDRSWGGFGNDRIFANRGRDRIHGGVGNDELWALARGDVTGPGDTEGDVVRGGRGDDTIRTRDGEVDRVFCGPGNDTALLDLVDKAHGCENVVRAEPAAGEDAPENAEEPDPEV